MGKEKSGNTFWDKRIGKWILAIGSVSSFLFGAFGTYMYLKKDVPNFEANIVSESRLINNQDRLPKLQVLVDSVDLLSNEKNISIYSVRVTNTGSKDISICDYDTGNIGLIVHNGSILESPSVIEASSEYLVNKTREDLYLNNDSIIVLPNTILNIGDSYLLHFCVLHDKQCNPTFKSFGQIVGQKEIIITNKGNIELNDWEVATKGPLNIQLVRLFVYGFSLIMGALTVMVLCYWLSLLYKLIKRAVFFSQARKRGVRDFIIKDYRKNGYDNIRMAYIIKDTDDKRLTECYKRAKDFIKVYNPDKHDENSGRRWNVSNQRISVYERLARLGYLIIYDDGRVCQAKSSLPFVAIMYELLERYKYIDIREMGLGQGPWEYSVMLGDYTEAD